MNLLQQKILKPVSFTNVVIDDVFWSPRIKVNREQTIPHQYKQCKETGRIDAFKLNWKHGMENEPHIFWDSDVAKWLEAASYSLATHPDPELDLLVDEVIALISSAQQPDGYLNVYFTVVKPGERWTDLRDAHELYCAGHLMEAGAAHFEATKKRTLLDVVCRYADHIESIFGYEEVKKRGYCGHQEIELALVKLYRVTGEKRYLKLSQFFIDERGQEPHYFTLEKEESKGFFDNFMNHLDNIKEYNQSHKPVREQNKVVGHSVRAMYMYSAMADLAGEIGDESLLKACERLWEHLHMKNMFITGGIGSTGKNEGFTYDYDLPNETSYAETCAAIGLVYWNHRMLQLECDGKYADAMERALYNGVISGVSLDGKKFFYANPLASLGDRHRKEWFGCACCPPNLARLLASLGNYIYSQNIDDIVVHLYVQGEATFHLHGQEIKLKQKTDYPWNGKISITLDLESSATFGVKLRIPEWCKKAQLKVNNKEIEITDLFDKGYVRIEREWKNNDRVELELFMPIERIYSHPKVRQNVNTVAIQRGPIIYCLESIDNSCSLHEISLPPEGVLKSVYDETLLGGVVKIIGEAELVDDDDWENKLYSTNKPKNKPFQITAIPYYAWDNRASGQMRVWIHER
ncbi:beta-L-arabinofuranosidase domain-containing protein [uncultured Metabacillus sp.]|uniref:glycoside hydrolase family 127 protein n=1 Tax=uncultured Metabacillus sp. TaxID=2860135 RepID=UPI0026309873|nr:beta-L-arabinofuranosidase domain-containing protein [uncultured Metabacillus sp.]